FLIVLHSLRSTHHNMSVLVFFFLLLLSPTTANNLCFERDQCNRKVVDYREVSNSETIKERNCFCDKACFRYDDCCEDIKHFGLVNNDKQQQQQEQLNYTCVDYMYPFRVRSEPYTPTIMPVWMITNCLSNYEHTQLALNCTKHSEQDMFLSH